MYVMEYTGRISYETQKKNVELQWQIDFIYKGSKIKMKKEQNNALEKLRVQVDNRSDLLARLPFRWVGYGRAVDGRGTVQMATVARTR